MVLYSSCSANVQLSKILCSPVVPCLPNYDGDWLTTQMKQFDSRGQFEILGLMLISTQVALVAGLIQVFLVVDAIVFATA